MAVSGRPYATTVLELTLPHLDQRQRQAEITVTNLLDDPNVGGLVLNTRDISDRKKSEAALLQSEARLRAVVGTAVDAIITINPAGTIESLNRAAEGMFGYTHAELLGRNVNVLMPPPVLRAA